MAPYAAANAGSIPPFPTTAEAYSLALLAFSPVRVARLAALLATVASVTLFLFIGFGPVEGVSLTPAGLVFVVAWTLAPLLAVAGTHSRTRAGAIPIALAFVLELTSYMSMGGGFVFLLVCGPLLLISLVAYLIGMG